MVFHLLFIRVCFSNEQRISGAFGAKGQFLNVLVIFYLLLGIKIYYVNICKILENKKLENKEERE